MAQVDVSKRAQAVSEFVKRERQDEVNFCRHDSLRVGRGGAEKELPAKKVYHGAIIPRRASNFRSQPL